MMPTAIVAYLALFATTGLVFVLASLLLGKIVRANAPTTQKLETYECGEPAVGPGSVQFDLRFYVVALVFLIFEVEVAFFFPTATVFGMANQLLAGTGATVAQTTTHGAAAGRSAEDVAAGGVLAGEGDSPTLATISTGTTPCLRTVARAAMLDLGLFFAVLLVGFAYVWKQGDLDWVRAIRHPAATLGSSPAALEPEDER